MKKISKKDTPFKDRYTGVLLEKMNDGIMLIAEGHTILKKGQEEIKVDLKKIKSTQDNIHGDLIKFKQDYDQFVVETRSSFHDVFQYLKHIDEEIKADWEKRLQRLEEIVLRRQ